MQINTHGGSDLVGVFFTTFSIFTFGARDDDEEAAFKLKDSKLKCRYRFKESLN